MPTVTKVRGPRSLPIRDTEIPPPKSKLSLPEHPNVPPKDFWAYLNVVYGDKSVGKSTLWSYYPNALLMSWEERRKNLPVKMIPDFSKGEKPLSFSRALDYRDLILSLPEKRRPSVVVQDTVDRLWVSLQRYHAKQEGYKDPGGFQWADWDKVDELLADYLWSFQAAGVGCAVTSHSKKREITAVMEDSAEIATIGITAPSCAPRCLKVLVEVADFIMYYSQRGYGRMMTIRGGDSCVTGCNPALEGGIFLTKSAQEGGEPLVAFPIPANPKTAYKTVIDAFHNKPLEGFITISQAEAARRGDLDEG